MTRGGKVEKEHIQISLRYQGPDVEDGSMSVEDIVPVLQGFASAYGKIASSEGRESEHRIRIVGIHRGSAEIALDIVHFIGENKDVIVPICVVGGFGLGIINLILKVISLKRHVKKQPYKDKIVDKNTIKVENNVNISIEVPFKAFELFKSGMIDNDIFKMIRPLEKGQIDAIDITAKSEGVEPSTEHITYDDKPAFEIEEIETTTTREVDIPIRLNRLTKSTNNGSAFLGNGNQVPFEYKGDDPNRLYRLFAYNGPLRAHCVAKLDENLQVLRLEIMDLEKISGDLFPEDKIDT
jgi:hypothetical protein